MKTFKIDSEINLDFGKASAISEGIADALLGVNACISWYDRRRDHECPAHVSECHDACEVPGYLDYARNRGAELRVDVNGGEFVFCYRSVAEFG